MNNAMFTLEIFGHNLLVYVGLEGDLMNDALPDPSLVIFEDDVQILGVFVRNSKPLPLAVPEYTGEGIRDMLSKETLERFQTEGLIEIQNHLSVERAANQATRARDDWKASRGG